MNMSQGLPIEILDLIFETACELELFEQAARYPMPLEYRPRPGRRLKPFAAVACQVCRLWREIIESSSVFWVSEHPCIKRETWEKPLERECDLDLHLSGDQVQPITT